MVRITLDKPYVPIPVTNGLELTFDNIANVPVANASSVTDWNTLFDLPTNGSPFTSVVVDGDVVTLMGGSGITLAESLFFENTHLLKFKDTATIVECGNNTFCDCEYLNTIILPVATKLGDNAFCRCQLVENFSFPLVSEIGASCFEDCLASEYILPSLETALDAAFIFNPNVTEFNFPLLTSIGDYTFYACIGLTTIYLPAITTCGTTTGNDYVFSGISGNSTILTIPAALMTCNGGNPDGDIEDLQANNTVTIVMV